MALTIPQILQNKKARDRAIELFEEGLTTKDVAKILTDEGLGSPGIGKDLRRALIEKGLVDELKLIVPLTRYTGEQIQKLDQQVLKFVKDNPDIDNPFQIAKGVNQKYGTNTSRNFVIKSLEKNNIDFSTRHKDIFNEVKILDKIVKSNKKIINDPNLRGPTKRDLLLEKFIKETGKDPAVAAEQFVSRFRKLGSLYAQSPDALRYEKNLYKQIKPPTGYSNSRFQQNFIDLTSKVGQISNLSMGKLLGLPKKELDLIANTSAATSGLGDFKMAGDHTDIKALMKNFPKYKKNFTRIEYIKDNLNIFKSQYDKKVLSLYERAKLGEDVSKELATLQNDFLKKTGYRLGGFQKDATGKITINPQTERLVDLENPINTTLKNTMKNLELYAAPGDKPEKFKNKVDVELLNAETPQERINIFEKYSGTKEAKQSKYLKGLQKVPKIGKIATGIISGTTGLVGLTTLASAGEKNNVEYGDPDTWGMKVGQFIEENPYTSGVLGTGATATTKLGRKAIGQVLKTGLPIRYGPTGVAYDLATADYSDPMSRLYLEGELAIAPATVKGTSKAAAQASRIFGSNPAVRRFLERAVNLGARAPTALKFARVASPIGLASLGLEGLYYTYKKAKETQDAIAAMSEEERQNYLSEQELQSLMGEAEFATGGRVGFETGGPGDKKKTTPLLDKPTIGIDPFELNKPVDLAKRDTLKGAGILGAGVALGKLGLLKLGKTAKVAKAAKVAPLTKIIPPLGKTMTQFPKWFPTLISKVRKEGKQIPIYKEVEVTLTKPEYDKLSKEGAKVYDRYLGRTDWYKEKLKKEGVPRYYTNKKTNEIIGYEYEVKDLPDVKVTEYGGEELTVSFPNAYGKNVTMEYTPPKGTKDATFKVDDAVPEWGASPDDAPDFYAETVNSLDEVYGGASRIEQKVLKLKNPRITQGDEVVARAEAQYDYIKDTAGDLDEF